MLSAEEIEKAKSERPYRHPSEVRHEHDDCIRMAYEWLDAQTKIKSRSAKTRPLKHIIEKWSGRYVSQSDVEIAAHMHPEISGDYPRYNISSRLIEPNLARLDGISEANKHDYRQRFEEDTYSSKE